MTSDDLAIANRLIPSAFHAVPLHVLYSYGTESSEDELPPFPPLSTITGRPLNKSAAHKTRGGSSRGARGGRGGSNKSAVAAVQPSHSSTTSKRGRKPSHCTSNADIRLKHMRKCFRAAGFQKQRLRELWKGKSDICTICVCVCEI